MAMFKDVLETVRMIEKENLDIRTITMGISLMDCIDADGEKPAAKFTTKSPEWLSTWYPRANASKPSLAFQSSINVSL